MRREVLRKLVELSADAHGMRERALAAGDHVLAELAHDVGIATMRAIGREVTAKPMIDVEVCS